MSIQDQLARLTELIQAEIPSIDARAETGEIVLEHDGGPTRLRDRQIARFTARERSDRRLERRSYADLGTGELFVDEPGLVLLVRLGKPITKLTPQQCAILAKILEMHEPTWLAEAQAMEPRRFREVLAGRTGIQITPSGTTKLRTALTNSRLLKQGRPSPERIFDAILTDFRLDSIGRAIRLPTPAGAGIEWLRGKVDGHRVVDGVSSVLGEKTGAIIEPADVLVTRAVAVQLEQTLGGALKSGFRGPSMIVRGVTRLSLDELTFLGSGRILPILAVADAAASKDPIQRESANRLANEWRWRWR